MKLFFIACYLLLGNVVAHAQAVAVNTDMSAPHASAILDVKSFNKGMLLPRTSTISRNAISNPAKGLIVYDTTALGFWVYNGTAWTSIAESAISNYWSANGTNIFNNNAGNIGIGTNTPAAPLHLKNDDEALRIQGIRPYLTFYDNAGIYKGYIQSFNNNLFIGTPAVNTQGSMAFLLGNKSIMTLMPFGSMYLGDNAFSYHDFSIGRISNSFGLSVYSNRTELTATNNMVINPAFGSGYLGINTSSPSNKLQVGSMGTTSFAGNDLAIGNGSNAMAFYQTDAGTYWGATTDIVLRPRNNGSGYVGINTFTAPTNKLQIGSVGNTGFATNDLAIGNGTAAMAIYQTNASTLIGSSTDIILRPRNNGLGRVGINTNTPRAPLDVVDAVSVNPSYPFYSYLNYMSFQNGIGSVQTNPPATVPSVTIIASGRVYATEFDSYSDARIKNRVSVSNSKKDLETINALHITDYTMKDKVKYGDQKFKKVIAQEVEKVYPQVVSKHADFIPNVYQVTSNIERTATGYLLSFAASHHISPQAKKISILLSDKEGMQSYDIIAIPADNKLVIDAAAIETTKAFVYGEEVDDFRTVDYEGLTTLNISATQELSKALKRQQQQINIQQQQIYQLLHEIRKLQQPLHKLSNLKQTVESED